jgi:hypothetical protein
MSDSRKSRNRVGAGPGFARLGVEALEAREVMTASLTAGPLVTVGSSEAHFSPIQAEYQRLGGARGVLGAATSGEISIPGGGVQHFKYGDIYSTQATGAHEVHGAILQEYNSLGGAPSSVTTTKVSGGLQVESTTVRPGSFLGFPISDELAGAIAGSRVEHFQHGDVYFSAATGAHEAHGAIDAKYNATAGSRDVAGRPVQSVLGLPTSDETSAPNGGRVSHFQGGDVYWSASTGANVVYGAIFQEYKRLGGAGSFLGLPSSDEMSGGVGSRVSYFQHGAIVWSSQTGAITVKGSTHAVQALLAQATRLSLVKDAGGPSLLDVLVSDGSHWRLGAVGIAHLSSPSTAGGAHTVTGAALSDVSTFHDEEINADFYFAKIVLENVTNHDVTLNVQVYNGNNGTVQYRQVFIGAHSHNSIVFDVDYRYLQPIVRVSNLAPAGGEFADLGWSKPLTLAQPVSSNPDVNDHTDGHGRFDGYSYTKTYVFTVDLAAQTSKPYQVPAPVDQSVFKL